MAARARHPPSCISAWSARASSISGRTPRRRARELARQSRHLARLHRSGADRSDRHRLEPRGQSPKTPRISGACGSDASAMAKAIALYVAKNNRAGSPKYLFGESYGGFRAAKTARALQTRPGHRRQRHRHAVAVAEGWLTFGDDSNPRCARPCNCRRWRRPSSSASTPSRREALAAAEKFAMTEYLMTLAGPPPKGDAAKAFYNRVAQISGLPLDIVTQARGFVADAYVKSLRAAEGKIVSRYDASFCRRRSLSRGSGRRGRRSDPRRRHARLWRRLGVLCAQRTRLQDRDDLCAARRATSPAIGTGRRPRAGQRRRRSARRCSPSARRSAC